MSLQVVVELLNKQKIIENMVRRQDLVEGMVQTRHLVEMQAALSRLPAADIGRILESLPAEDAARLWRQVGRAREDEILWELPESLREQLAGSREPRGATGEISAYELVDGRARVVAVTCPQDLEAIKPIWIDLLGASKAERGWVGQHYGLDLPDPDDVTDLEASARFYKEENDEVHLHSNFLLDGEGQSRSVPVAFVVHSDTLFTVRNEELAVFRLQRLRTRNQPGTVSDCKDVLLDLYDSDVEFSADALEDAYSTLRRIGQEVLNETVSDSEAARILAQIAEEEDLNGRIRGNMLDTQRALSFLIRGRFLSPSQADATREILRDIESLNSHTAFLFEKINFLLDATVGFININQNKRVSQLTVLGVVFMPINVLAGIGGMSEFSMMTHAIPWPIAYSVMMVAMTAIGWMTYSGLKLIERRQNRRVAASERPRNG